MEFVWLFAAGFLGGILNSLAGGGSFVVFPALLLAGVPPVMANATNTFATLSGYMSGAWGFREDILQHRDKLLQYALIAAAGGILGALLLLQVSDAQFEVVVPWLLAVATLLFAFGGNLASALARHSADKTHMQSAVQIGLGFVLFIVCFYGGFFNAGLGIITLAFLALAGFTNIHAMNGLKLLIASIVAIVAVVLFAISGTIAWGQGLAAFFGTLVGGYMAARLAQFVPQKLIRIGVIVYAIGLTLVFFYQTYFTPMA